MVWMGDIPSQVPPSGLGWGTPLDMGWGTPLDMGWSTPLDMGQGTHGPEMGTSQTWDRVPPQTWDGVPPGPEMGYPPRQISIASNCYTAGGMPLAFTQEDFLVQCYNHKMGAVRHNMLVSILLYLIHLLIPMTFAKN